MRCGGVLLLTVAIVVPLSASSRAQEPIPYGAPINLELALKLMAALSEVMKYLG